MTEDSIELSHLRYFVAVAEELHFGRAAARLHISQPPLTRQVQQLESRLGCQLFDRNSRSTRLTAAGAQFLERARAILSESSLAFQTIQRIGRGEEGHLTVATAPSLMLTDIPKTIRLFRKRHPLVEFRLLEMASSVILQAVRTGTADLGYVRGRDKDAEIEVHARWKEPMVAIVPRDFPAPAAAISPAALRAEPFVFFPRHLGPSFYDEVMDSCRRAGFLPSVAQEARQWSSIVSLVSAGMGISIGPQSVAALLPKAARYIPLPGFTTTVRMVGRRGGIANPAVTNFLQLRATPPRA